MVYWQQNGKSWNWSLWREWEFLKTDAEICSWGKYHWWVCWFRESPGRSLWLFPFQSKHLHFLFISHHLIMATSSKKRLQAAEELLPSLRALCYRRCENLGVRCPLVLITKVTECLTFDRWQITGEPFRKTALQGTNFQEEVKIMGWKRYGKHLFQRSLKHLPLMVEDFILHS